MVQKDFIKAIAKDANEKLAADGKNTISEGATGQVIKSFVTVTTDALAKGDQIAVPGLGTFKSVHKEASTGRNPATGQPIQIPAKNVPKFKAAKALKDALLK